MSISTILITGGITLIFLSMAFWIWAQSRYIQACMRILEKKSLDGCLWEKDHPGNPSKQIYVQP